MPATTRRATATNVAPRRSCRAVATEPTHHVAPCTAALRRRTGRGRNARRPRATSSARGWNASAASSVDDRRRVRRRRRTSNRYVTQPPSKTYMRIGSQLRRQLGRPFEAAQARPRRSAPRSRRRHARSPAGAASPRRRGRRPGRSRARTAQPLRTVHVADRPAGRERRRRTAPRWPSGTDWAIRIITLPVPHVGCSAIGSSAGVEQLVRP